MLGELGLPGLLLFGCFALAAGWAGLRTRRLGRPQPVLSPRRLPQAPSGLSRLLLTGSGITRA